MSFTIAVIFLHIGPYHVARLNRLGDLAARQGLQVIALEVCSKELSRPWEVTNLRPRFAWRTLFPDRTLEEVSKFLQFKAVFAKIAASAPDAVVTAGRGPGWAGAQVQVVPDASVAAIRSRPFGGRWSGPERGAAPWWSWGTFRPDPFGATAP